MIIKLPRNFSKGQTQRDEAPASFILHERGKQHHWQGAGALSIKSFYHGQAFYNVGTGCHAVNDDSYLVLNHGQPYSITIDAEQPIESFCIFYAEGLEKKFIAVSAPNPKICWMSQSCRASSRFIFSSALIRTTRC